MIPSSLAVIGLGAIGGSLAWQARLAGVTAKVWGNRIEIPFGDETELAELVESLESAAARI